MIFVAGFRRSFPVAAYLAYMLGKAGKRAVLVDGVAGMQLQQAETLDDGDLLIVISFAPYSEESIELVEAAKLRCPVIAMTVSVLSPIAKDAKLVLQVREAEVRGFRSLAASMCLAPSLAIGVAISSEERASVARRDGAGLVEAEAVGR
jgi:DNA-binding MurR/RpiR family transcriptional regulator